MRMRLHKLLVFSFLLSVVFGLHANDRHESLKQELITDSYIEGDEALRVVDSLESYAKLLLHDMEHHGLNVNATKPSLDQKTLPLPYSRDQHWWWTLLKEKKLKMNDTTVVWPKFLKFCVNVYNWADKTFNSYDPEYVIGTGKRWKARLVSDNWLDSYALRFTDGINSNMSSNVYANIGAYVQYMAVSLGYSYDVEKLFKGKEPSHRKFEFGFSCALFNAELYYHENEGGVNIRTFGDFKPDKKGTRLNEYFPGVKMYNLGFDIYYFFNNKRYSQGAAYNFAKYQLKSQGSFLLGISITNQRLTFDLNQLPEKFKQEIDDPSLIKEYFFHYNSYSILAGYGYNWVIAPKLLFNVTAMPAVGFSHYYEDSLEGNKYLISLSIQGRISLTYNLGNYFFGLLGKMNGHLYKQGKTSMFSSIENFSAYIGLRF